MEFTSKYNKSIKISIHIIIWVVLFSFPLFFSPFETPDYAWITVHAWIPLMEYMIVFYLNYFIFTTRFFFENKWLLFILMNSALVIVFILINGKGHGYLMHRDGIHRRPPPPPGFKKFPPHHGLDFVLKDVVSFFIPVAFAIAIRSTENWIKTESEKKEIENRNLESELQHLRYQLQPHFFFNSLNNIYSLVEQSPNKAQEAIHSLSKLMRYLLYDVGKDKIELSQEIDFLKKYIQLMELRHNDQTIAHFVFPDTKHTHFKVAPLLFIPIIENAYKHGISATQPSDIMVEMVIKEEQLYFSSSNTNFPKNRSDKSGSGIGLNNLRKRLQLIYPKKHQLTIEVVENVYSIKLQIALNV